MKIRNIAIIAHVDHGKTTLVDNMLKQAGTLNVNVVSQFLQNPHPYNGVNIKLISLTPLDMQTLAAK